MVPGVWPSMSSRQAAARREDPLEPAKNHGNKTAMLWDTKHNELNIALIEQHESRLSLVEEEENNSEEQDE